MTDLENMASFGKLYEAHKKCRRGKQDEKSTVMFEMNLAFELTLLSRQLLDYTYRLGGYHEFMVHDPKQRRIQALGYRDRVVQHSLCGNVLQPRLEPKLIYDNSACRKGKGTHFAMGRLSGFFREYYKRHGAEGYILKFDVKKYFDSICHSVLLGQMREVFGKDREMFGLIKMVVDSFEVTPGRGLPMGNQSSQWFALYYLNGLDHFIKEKLQIRYYTRYMDDGVLLHWDREWLRHCLAGMEAFVNGELQVEFNQKTQIVPMAQGVDYLGFHFYLTDTGKVVRRLRTSSKKRLKRRLGHFKRAYRDGKIELPAVTRSLAASRGHLSHGDTHAFQKNLLGQFVLKKGSDGTTGRYRGTKEDGKERGKCTEENKIK